ncbi:MAG: FHA domain-containing protein [Anaerolineae bacterium]|nr:FHA domain-containing protein [Anaerolineae bacterium]
MTRCPSCGEHHPLNTLFCDECGAFLLAEEYQPTDILAAEDVDWMGTELPAVTSAGDTITRQVTLRVSVVDSGRQVEFPLSKEISMGRLDATTASFPDIDLTTDGALENGVSRRHAKIVLKGADLFLEDLGSVNGTFLNGKRLTPYLPHALNSEDEIRLGKILMRVQVN